jgi:phosphoserine phosphatase
MLVDHPIETTLDKLDVLSHDLLETYDDRSSSPTLPSLPQPTFTIAGWNQPAKSIGGDYSYWQTNADTRLWFSLADVSGHGPASAAIARQYHSYFRAAIAMTPTLEQVMHHLNTRFVHVLSPCRFITAAVGVLEPLTCRLRLSSAGHGPLFFYHAASDTLAHWRANTIPLGITHAIPTDAPHDVTFAPGDLLVLVTDGFFEWTNPSGELFGLERLQQAIYDRHHLAPDAIITEIYHEVRDFTAGTQQPDDLTVVILKRTDDNLLHAGKSPLAA